MLFPSHLPLFDHSNCIWRRAQVTKLLIMQFLQRPAISSLLGPYCQIVTTSKDHALTVVHIHTRSSRSVTVITSRCLAAAFKGGRSPCCGFHNYPRPQLLTSHTNSSKQLNPSGYLTH
jgi:hypothetical protein